MASAITPAKSGAAGAPLAQSCTPLHTVARRTTSAHSPDGMHAATPAPAAQAAARPIPLNTAVRPKPKQVRYAKSTYARLKECVSEDHAVINAHVHAVWLVIPESERAKCGHDITQFTAYATASIRRRLKASATVARSAKRKRLSEELIAPEPRMLAPIASESAKGGHLQIIVSNNPTAVAILATICKLGAPSLAWAHALSTQFMQSFVHALQHGETDIDTALLHHTRLFRDHLLSKEFKAACNLVHVWTDVMRVFWCTLAWDWVQHIENHLRLQRATGATCPPPPARRLTPNSRLGSEIQV